jgi:DNA mismatch endonuclease (patch repair protein)
MKESWGSPNRLDDKKMVGNRLKEARSNYMITHPEHQSCAGKKSPTSYSKINKPPKQSKETRRKASETFKKHYKEGKFKHWCIGRKLSDSHKEALRKGLAESLIKGSKLENIVFNLFIKNNLHPVQHYPFGKNFITSMDFAFIEQKIAIYIDGCYWHGCPEHHPERIEKYKKDRNIDKYLAKSGWVTLRFWEHDIKQENFEKVFIEKISYYLIGNI